MAKKFASLVSCSLVLIALATGCSSTPSTPDKSEKGGKGAKLSKTELRDQKDFKAIQALFGKGAYEATLAKSLEFENKHPSSPNLSQVTNLHGLALLLSKRPAEAEGYFRKSLEQGSSNKSFSQYVLYNLASAQFEMGKPDDALKTLGQMNSDLLDGPNKSKYHQLRAQALSKKEAYLDSAREILKASTEAPAASSGLSAQLQQSLEKIANTMVLDELYRENESHTFGDLILLELIQKNVTQNNLQRAGEHLNTLKQKFPQSPLIAHATQLVYTTSSGVKPIPPVVAGVGGATTTPPVDAGPVNTQAVGVLLPLKGRFGKFATRTLQGIELAFRIFNDSESESKIHLVIEDSGEDPEQVVAALTRLVKNHQVVAVIGPLLSKGIEQVAQKAQELGVPLISLARHTGNGGAISDYTIQSGLSIKLQTEAIAKFAIEHLNLKRFAILAPQDKAGQESARMFWDAIEANGGKIVGNESYQPGETDFRQPVDKLAGLYLTDARQRELDALAKQRDELKIRKKTRKTEQYFNLKPIIDFEAVFIPEEPKTSGQIIPTFAYRDVDKVRFLGTSAWNSPDFVTRVETSAEGAFFVDAFSPESTDSGVKPFIDKYRSTFGQDPTTMEAISFDAGRVLEYVIQGGAKSRREVLDRIKEIRNFPGVTGKISFLDGQLVRELGILSVQNGKIISVK